MAGISEGIRDSKKNDQSSSDQKALPPGQPSTKQVSSSDLAAAALPLAGGITPFGLSKGATSLALAFTAFSSLDGYTSYPNVFALIPESKVVNGDPLLTVETEMIKALEKVLKAKISYTPTRIQNDKLFNKQHLRQFVLTGAPCKTGPCYLFFDFSQSEQSERSVPKIIHSPPAWLGNEPVYAFSHIFPRLKSSGQGAIEENAFAKDTYQQLFANLPDWFYFYVPGTFPQLYNKEETLHFIAPN